MAHQRIRLDELVPPPVNKDDEGCTGPAMGHVTFLNHLPSESTSTTAKAYANEVIAAVRELVKLNPVTQEHIHEWCICIHYYILCSIFLLAFCRASRTDFSDPMKLADFAASITSADGSDLQRVLSATDPEERLSITLELLNKEKKIAQFQKEISDQVEKKMSKQQREYMLREQLKAIQKELGVDKDDRTDLVAKFRERISWFRSNGNVPEATLVAMEEELSRLSGLEKTSPDYNVARNYLDWLTSLPFNKFSVSVAALKMYIVHGNGFYQDDELDLDKASQMLEKDHFGLEDVKKRVLEFIAVSKLKGGLKNENGNGDGDRFHSKVLCLVGPPGLAALTFLKNSLLIIIIFVLG